MTNANMVEIATNELSEHEEIFYQSAEFWVSVAFLLVVIALFSPIMKIIRTQAQKRIARIKKELQEAEELKLDAQRLYADYERKLLNADNEVAAIVTEENAAIEDAKKRRMHDLDVLLKQKQREADSKIEIAFERANNEINTLISQKTMKILQTVISQKLTSKNHAILIDNAIKNISKISFDSERVS